LLASDRITLRSIADSELLLDLGGQQAKIRLKEVLGEGQLRLSKRAKQHCARDDR